MPLASAFWITTTLGTKLSADLQTIHTKCWTSKQFWDVVDSWSPEERAAFLDHYIVDEIIFPLSLSLALMIWVCYEAQTMRISKGIASVALLLAALGGIFDVVENELHMSYLGVYVSTDNPPVDLHKKINDILVSIATTIAISKYVCSTVVITGLIINRCRSYMCSTAKDADTVAE